jgi:glycosyltransferase involved in cell wall biosynthesis
MENDKGVEYSIIIPVFNSEATLDILTNRLQSVCYSFNEKFEIIYIDDCSRDNSWNKLKIIAEKNKNIKIIHLLQNYGQHNAIFCGFQYCKGNYVITIDDDLQTPPEEIPKLIRKLSEGYSVVYARYQKKNHSKIENYFSTIFQRFIHYILKIPNEMFISSFAIYRKEVIDRIKSIKTSNIFLPALIEKGVPLYSIANVDVSHHPREFGKSNYSILKYINLFLNLLVNYSSLPLVTVGIFGLIISILSFIFGVYLIINRILNPEYGLMGWNSLMVTITLIGGTILISLAVVGEYLHRILREIAYEQPYIVDEIQL